MKKIITTLLVTLTLSVSLFGKGIHVNHAYLMEKDKDGHVYVIRVYVDGNYHDWYVIPSDKPWLFYGYEDHTEIIVDTTTDIAVIR